MKDAMGLVNDIQSGKGDPLSMLEKALDIAKNVKGINITDLIKFDGNGRFDFSKSGDAIQKYIDSLFDTEEISKQLKELFPDMSEVDISSFVSSFKAAAQAEIEATNETENLQNALSNLSTAISNASSAGSLLQDIAGGEKNDLEIFQEIIQLAEAAGVGVETFISSFDGSKVQWNTDAISNIRDEFLETVQAFEDEHPEASGLTEYFKQLTESAESADAFGDAINNTSNATERAKLFADRSDIAAQIEALTTLQSQYDALTSKYNKWQQAQSMGEEGDMYDNITGGLENINNLYKEGLIGTNKFKSALEMMTGMDTTGMSSADLVRAYEEAYPKMKRYFTEGIQHSLNTLNNQIEASAYTGEPKDYGAVRKQEKKNLNTLNKEADALRKKLAQAVASGEIKEGSDVWYQMVNAIAAVEEEAQQTAIAIKKSYKDAFDSIEAAYSNTLSSLENRSKSLQNDLNMIEAKGYLGGAALYKQLKDVESQTINERKKELKELEASLAEAVNSGEIKKGSDEWYAMRNAIDSTKASIQESEIQLVEYDKKIRQLKWDTFDYLQERIGSISNETNFLIDLLSYSDLFDDNGAFTSTGNATLGLHTVNYDVYTEQVKQYTDALRDLDKEISKDPHDTKLIERREELLKLQRDSVLAIEQEKKAVADLVEEGIRVELDALKELIDKYNESIDGAKELYDYQKQVAQQSNTIATLQKQIAAYSGDTSEENRARLQKLRNEYENANEELQEMQYDKYINDQKKLLDNLYDEYEDVLNRRLDDVDALMREIIDSTRNNSETIRSTIERECTAVGIAMTKVMNEIWSVGGKTGTAVKAITNGFASGGFVADAQRSVYKNGDDIVTINTLKSGEAVLTPEQAAQFKQLVNYLPTLQKMMDVSSNIRTLTPISSTSNNIDMGGFNLNFQIDHVQDYNDLVKQMRDDKRFERMIQAITVDPLVGKTTLTKKKFYN